MLRSAAHWGDVEPEPAMFSLAFLLVHTYAAMDSENWKLIATCGALLWGAAMA